MIDRLIERHRDALILVARILLTTLFVISGFEKVVDFSGTVSYMEYVHAPAPSVSAVVSVVMELLIGVALLVGIRVRPLALVLLVFVAVAAFVGHPFWSMDATERAVNQAQFFKNVSIMGGLLLLAITGPGRYSLSK